MWQSREYYIVIILVATDHESYMNTCIVDTHSVLYRCILI